MDRFLKNLKGHSGSVIELRQNGDVTYVSKIGGVHRNYERLNALRDIVPLPKIYAYEADVLDMEYIHGLDIKTYLSMYPVNDLIKFLHRTIQSLSEVSQYKDYTEAYNKKLESIDFSVLPFTKQELIDKLPKRLPMSNYHGDLTLDNILYRMSDKQFVCIDPLTSEYDSYVFDLVKLRQDLVCKWFIRNDNVYFDAKMEAIHNALSGYEYFNNDYILILMLLRVLPYSKDKDIEFLLKWIERLWK